MKVVIAIDSFKECITSMEAGEAVSLGIKRVCPLADITVCPLADGGEGTVDALVHGMGGMVEKIQVHDPLDRRLKTYYGILPEQKTAVIEMASAAGLNLLTDKEKNPLYTTTFGVGEMIRDAIEKGCRNFIIGIGGSATNDGGVGMLKALGFEFLDARGRSITANAVGLADLKEIRTEHAMPELKECHFRVACDVKNPLCGSEGASRIYGPQKGATPKMMEQMDRWLLHYASLAQEINKNANPNVPGTGAAGGLGFAFLAFTNAVLEPGIQIVMEETRLEEKIADADYVITGEGRIDRQTAMGKAPIGVAAIAKKYQIPVLAFAGSVCGDVSICNERGIDGIFSILQTPQTLEEALEPERTRNNLSAAAEQVFHLLGAVESHEKTKK